MGAQDLSDAPSKTSPQTAADVLRAAADLIEPEGAWCQGPTAQDADGQPSGVHEDAVCFCAYGAIMRVAPDYALQEEAYGACYPAVGAAGFPGLVAFNESPERAQAEVVALLREVAAKLDGEERETARHSNSEPATRAATQERAKGVRS